MSGAADARVRGWRQAARRHRPLVAAVLAASAMIAGLVALAPPSPARVEVLAAARTLAAGRPLSAGDVTTVALPPAAVPDGALRPGAAVIGRVLAGAVRRHEPLTDVRLAGPGLLAGVTGEPPDTVAAPVRVADAGAAALVEPGERVDVLATPPDGAGPAEVVAADVVVLLAVRPGGDVPADEGGLIVVATSRPVAASLARAAVGDQLSLTVRGP